MESKKQRGAMSQNVPVQKESKVGGGGSKGPCTAAGSALAGQIGWGQHCSPCYENLSGSGNLYSPLPRRGRCCSCPCHVPCPLPPPALARRPPQVPGKTCWLVWRTNFEIDERYTPIKAVGKGAYGVVCSAKNAATGEKVAIKKITNAFENLVDARRTLREMKLLRYLQHENVIAVRDIMRPPSKDAFNDVYIVYEVRPASGWSGGGFVGGWGQQAWGPQAGSSVSRCSRARPAAERGNVGRRGCVQT